MDAKLLFASLLELPKRIFEFDKSIQIIKNGEKNDYPDRVELLVENSITAKQASKLFRKYLTGKGLGDTINKTIVNPKTKQTLYEFLTDFNDDYSRHQGVFVHVDYNIVAEPVGYRVLPYNTCRRGKKDSERYSGKIAHYDDWTNTVKKDSIVWFDTFNPNANIVKSQIENAGGIEKYKGQIFFFNPSKYDYPFSHLHPVLNDADSEFRSGVFKNKSLRKGFFGKKIFVLPPMVDEQYRVADANLQKEQLANKREQEALRDNTKLALEGFVGVENHEGFMTLEMEFEGDDISKTFNVIDVKTDIDDKLFEYTETSASNNIRKAYSNVPPILIDSADSSFFGSSGEAMIQAKAFYNEQTEEDRELIEMALKKMFDKFPLIDTASIKILPLINVSQAAAPDQSSGDIEKKKAQAILKGSVGGVTALLQIQQSVSQGLTNRNAALTIIEEIYGIPRDLASEMLGNPKEEENNGINQ